MIRLQELTVHRGGELVLDLPELALEGGLVAIMGPNGAGKSTLLLTLTGQLPYQGTCKAPEAWHVPAAPPAPVLVDVEDVVRSHGAADPRAWLDRVGYSGPDVLARGSSGQRMLVALAGALSHKAPWLLLDEPAGHLDPPHVSRLFPELRERAARGGVLVTTHDPQVAARADQVLLLNRRVVARGSPREVLTAEHLSACYGGQVDVVWTALGPVVRAQG